MAAVIPSLEDMLQFAGEYAERSLVHERTKQLLPIYTLYCPEEIAVVACDWANDFEKQLAVLKVKKLAHERGALAMSFLTEAWMSTRQSYNPRWDLPPSQDPQRREIVVAYATDGRAELLRHWQIVRDRPGGRIISLVEDHGISSAGRFGGRVLDGILPVRT